MAKKRRNRAADYVTYLAVRALVCVVQMVSPRAAYAIADFIARLAYTLLKRRRRVALENVRASFPEMAADPGAADRLVRAMFRHFLRAIAELILLPRKLHPSTVQKYIRVDTHKFRDLFESRGLLLITGHFGNWEMAGFALGVLGFRAYGIARELDNPYLERFVLKFRQSTGQTILAKHGDFDRLTTILKAGGQVATLCDQDAGPRGVFVDFFGRPASTHKAAAVLARKHDAVIVVLGVPRVSRADYPQRADFEPSDPLAPLFYAVEVADVIDPREYADQPNALKAITQRYTSVLEELIRKHPEQYFWLHRRWKHQPKAKEDKPTDPMRAA